MSDSSEGSPGATAIRPFTIEIPEAEIEALRARIGAARWPTRELVADRSQGVQLATLQELARYWEHDYDWSRCEARLNALPQFTTRIDGVDIHFIHVRSPHDHAMPLVMTHGWPGSVIEMLEVVGPLTDPTAHGGSAEDAFHLVLPSLPGYGFSGEPSRARLGPWSDCAGVGRADAPGWATTATSPRAATWAPRSPTRWVAWRPRGLLGIHINLLVAASGRRDPPVRHRGGARRARAARHVPAERVRLLPGAGHPTADHRLRTAGLARRSGRLDARPRHRRLLQDLPRVPRQAAVRATSPATTSSTTSPCTGSRARGPRPPGRTGRADRPRRRRRPPGRLLRRCRAPGRLHTVPRTRSSGRRAAGSSRRTRTSSTSTRRTRAATSPPGSNPRSSRPRSAPPSDRCADVDAVLGAACPVSRRAASTAP